jgi:8-oxo-dGTP diphosphatase
MGFEDFFRISVHAVITDAEDRVLLLRANYGNRSWGLPGGALEPGETVHEALHRECAEELGCAVEPLYLSGIYHHSAINAHALIFRCEMIGSGGITLSDEHLEWAFTPLDALSTVQRVRVDDCLRYSGEVLSRRF